jgi:hypothetical protein
MTGVRFVQSLWEGLGIKPDGRGEFGAHNWKHQ